MRLADVQFRSQPKILNALISSTRGEMQYLRYVTIIEEGKTELYFVIVCPSIYGVQQTLINSNINSNTMCILLLLLLLTPSPQTHGGSNSMSLPKKTSNLAIVCDFIKKSVICSSERICESDIVLEVKCRRVK